LLARSLSLHRQDTNVRIFIIRNIPTSSKRWLRNATSAFGYGRGYTEPSPTCLQYSLRRIFFPPLVLALNILLKRRRRVVPKLLMYSSAKENQNPSKTRLWLFILQSLAEVKHLTICLRPRSSLLTSLIATEEYLAPFTVASSTKYRDILGQAHQWLSACRTEHKACSQAKSGELPTRLVAVEKKELQLHARLCDGLTLSPDTDYLTLSHCWGTTSFFTLKEDNQEKLRHSIPTSQLPQVFQDAILITYELGYRYIWIDSLCIIQDSEGASDWLRESPTMDRVYGNSVCNLAATGFYSGQEGLFPLGCLSEILPPKVSIMPSGTQNPSSSYYIISAEEWNREILRAPLHKRGWVYQEQIMVRFKVHG
jgi:Heterokaryon incompatibility protein (HET)